MIDNLFTSCCASRKHSKTCVCFFGCRKRGRTHLSSDLWADQARGGRWLSDGSCRGECNAVPRIYSRNALSTLSCRWVVVGWRNATVIKTRRVCVHRLGLKDMGSEMCVKLRFHLAILSFPINLMLTMSMWKVAAFGGSTTVLPCWLDRIISTKLLYRSTL